MVFFFSIVFSCLFWARVSVVVLFLFCCKFVKSKQTVFRPSVQNHPSLTSDVPRQTLRTTGTGINPGISSSLGAGMHLWDHQFIIPISHWNASKWPENVFVFIMCELFTGLAAANINPRSPFRHLDFATSATAELRRNPSLSAPDECARACREGEPPRICYYHFTLEYYTVLGA